MSTDVERLIERLRDWSDGPNTEELTTAAADALEFLCGALLEREREIAELVRLWKEYAPEYAQEHGFEAAMKRLTDRARP